MSDEYRNPDEYRSIEDMMRAENERIDDLLIPLAYRSSTQDLYVHWDEEKEEDILFSEKEYRRFLRNKGLRGTKLPMENISEVEVRLSKIDAKTKVDYIGKIACLSHGFCEVDMSHGFCEVDKHRFYNTGGLYPLVPSTGETEPINEALAKFLGGKNHEQFFIIKGALRRYYRIQRDGWRHYIPPMFILVGESPEEARIFLSLFTACLQTDSIDPTRCLKRLSSEDSEMLAGSNHWCIKELSENAGGLLHSLRNIERLPFGKITLPFISQKTVFVDNTATALMSLPVHGLKGLANMIYLHPLGNYKCCYEGSDFIRFSDELIDDSVLERYEDVRNYIAPEVSKTLFDASLAGEAYQVLCRNIPPHHPPMPETEILTHLENSSRHFQNRMNRQKESVLTILEVVSRRYPREVIRVSDTHWKFQLPEVTRGSASVFDE